MSYLSKQNRVRMKETLYEIRSYGKAPAAISDEIMGWQKLANTPFIRLHRIRCEPEAIWITKISDDDGYQFNVSIGFYLGEWERPFHWCKLFVSGYGDYDHEYDSMDNDDQLASPNKYVVWRRLEHDDVSFEGAIIPSQIYVYLSKGGHDNVATYTKNIGWYVTYFFEEVHEKIHPIAALEQKRKIRTP